MKVLSIQEPYATMILEVKKTIETRVWKTNYRGLILLHASKKPKSKISGKIFASAKIVDCKPIVKKDEKKACCEIYPRAYSWFLEEIRPTELKEVKGSLGLWEFDCELRERPKEIFYCQNCKKEVKFGVERCECGFLQLWALFG